MKPLLILLTVLLAACGGSDAKRSPDAGKPSPRGDEGVPPRDHPQLVYSNQTLALPMPDNRVQITKVVYSIDLQTGKRYQLAEYGGAIGGPVSAWLGDRNLVYATTTNVTRAYVDGRNAQEIFRLPQPSLDYITSAALSPDGTKVALMVNGGGQGTAGTAGTAGTVVFVETASGRELSRISRTAGAFDDFKGNLVWLDWRADSKAVVVTGAISSHVPGGVATVDVSGKVAIHASHGWVNVSPAGERAADGNDRECAGLLSNGQTLSLKDLASGRVLASVSDATKAYTPWTWSPDGREFLFQERDYIGACSLEMRYGLLSTSGAKSAVADVMQVYDRWYGKRLVTLLCAGEELTMPLRNGRQRWSCGDYSVAELRLAHKTVDQMQPGYQDVEVLGFLNY